MTELLRAKDDALLDAQGLSANAPNTICTWTGRRVDVLDLKPNDIVIDDIAHALSRLCRYNGHVDGYLSVARHSIWVSERLEDLFGKGSPLLFMGLLHDAAEAYLGDLTRPLKHHPKMAVFREIEEQAEERLAAVFGLTHPQPQAVKDADTWVLINRELLYARDHYMGDPWRDEADFLLRFEGLKPTAIPDGTGHS